MTYIGLRYRVYLLLIILFPITYISYIALPETSSDNSKEKEIVRVEETIITDSQELKDRIAIVTGAGSGLGKSIAIGIARAGANVVVLDLNEEEASQTCEFIRNENPGNKSTNILCDVTSEKAVIEAFKFVKNKLYIE